MGFGNGYGSRTKRGGKLYNNSMTAHVWNTQNENEGQSSNGNFYFRGRTLYSYGSHFVVGFIMPDGVAFLNADSYSVSTSGHQSDARGATSNRRTVGVAGLTELASDWKLLPRLASFLESRGVTAIERREMQANVRKALVDHATALTAMLYGPGVSRYKWDSDDGKSILNPGEQEAGAYLAAIAGLPAASWTKAKRDAAKLAAKAKRDTEQRTARDAETRALRYATMTDSEWRAYMHNDSAKYESFYIREGKALYHACRLAKVKGWSAKRRAVLKLRRADALRRKDSYDLLERGRQRWSRVKYQIEMFRSCQRILAGEATPGSGPHGISARTEATRKTVDALNQLATVHAFPVEARNRIMAESNRLGTGLQSLNVELATYREEQREIERLAQIERDRLARLEKADQIAAWLDGKDVRISFDAESGGTAMRIKGDVLQTSHGASVPLDHAIKAFRFVKLIRDREASNEGDRVAWRKNGETVRVGHFQLDTIFANGDFVAGCHSFTWPEVERVAKLAGVAG